MKQREMIEKVSVEQEAILDQKLASETQIQVAQMVRALPNEEPELFWRSQLSAKIHEVAAQRERKRRLAWTLKPAFGLAAATVLAVVFLYQPKQIGGVAEIRPNVEAQVLSAHREAVQLGSFWGSVRADDEARLASAPAKSEYEWDETDLGTL
jgi:hypothetical protein